MVVLIVAGVVSALLAFRVYAHFLDKRRILIAAQDEGWTSISIKWSPFAPGWFFESQERHYYVSYIRADGSAGGRFCKIRLLGGVYWRSEEPIDLPEPPPLN